MVVQTPAAHTGSIICAVPAGAVVRCVLLMSSVVGLFTPTVFYNIYGRMEMDCKVMTGGRQRQTETETETDKQTETEIETETDRDRDRDRQTETDQCERLHAASVNACVREFFCTITCLLLSALGSLNRWVNCIVSGVSADHSCTIELLPVPVTKPPCSHYPADARADQQRVIGHPLLSNL